MVLLVDEGRSAKVEPAVQYMPGSRLAGRVAGNGRIDVGQYNNSNWIQTLILQGYRQYLFYNQDCWLTLCAVIHPCRSLRVRQD